MVQSSPPSIRGVGVSGAGTDCSGWTCWSNGMKIGTIISSVLGGLFLLTMIFCYWHLVRRKRSLVDEEQVTGNRDECHIHQRKPVERGRRSRSRSWSRSSIRPPVPLTRRVSPQENHPIRRIASTPQLTGSSEASSNLTARAVVGIGEWEALSDQNMSIERTTRHVIRPMTSFFNKCQPVICDPSIFHDYHDDLHVKKKSSWAFRKRRFVLLCLIPLGAFT